jgi:hypothetical protein
MQRIENDYGTKTATIGTAANGQSDEVDLSGFELCAIQMPATWTTANLTFLASNATGGTFNDLYDDAGNEVSVTAAASRVISLDSVALKLGALRFIKVRSGTTGTPVQQGGSRALTLILKG